MKGELAEGVVPGLLRELYVGRRNGTLHFARGSEEQSVRVRRGHIVNARTNIVEERLGEILVRHGRLSADDLARATDVVISDKRRLGEVLVELGLIDEDGLEDAIALRVHELLARVFTWNEGTYSFEEEEEAPGELTLKLSTGELILEAVRAIRDPDVVRYALGDMNRVLALSSDPLLRFQQLPLSPNDGFVLSRVDGTHSAREIEKVIPLPPEDVRRSLLGLLSTGVLEYDRDSRRADPEAEQAPAEGIPPEEPPARENPPESAATEEPEEGAGDGTAGDEVPAKKPEPSTTPIEAPDDTALPGEPPPDTVPVEPFPGEAPEEAAPEAAAAAGDDSAVGGDEPAFVLPPADAGEAPGWETANPATGELRAPEAEPVEPEPEAEPQDDPGTAERRREIEEAWRGLQSKNHFEVLGLSRKATEADVKEAYFGLARRFHPDVHHGVSLGDLRDKLDAVFISLGEAYEVLRDTDKRRDYEERLGRQRPAATQGDKPGGGASPPAPDPQAKTERAEVSIRRAERLYAAAKEADDEASVRQNYFDAIQLVEPVLDSVSGALRLRAHLVLARCYFENPKWVKRAEETLQAAIRDEPRAVDAYRLLGGLYEERGLRTRATGMFRRILELRPDDPEAAQALVRLGPPDEPPPPDEDGGLIKKIFG